MVEFRRCFPLIAFLEFGLEFVAQFVRIQGLSRIVSFEPFIFFDIDLRRRACSRAVLVSVGVVRRGDCQ